MRTIRVIKNDKTINTQLNNSQVYFEVIPKIKGDMTIAGYFNGTVAKAEELEKKKGGKCKSCDLNQSKDLLMSFISELKKCPPDKQAAASSLLGNRQWVAHSNKWINIVTNEVEEIEYGEKQIPLVRQKTNPPTPIAKKEEPAPKEADQPPPHPAAPKKAEPTQKVEEKPQTEQKKLVFRNFQAPGDIVMMTAAIRDLHLNFPGRFITDVRTNSMPIWESNQYITKLNETDSDVQVHDLNYNLINQSNQGPFHFSEGFTEHLEELLGVRIKKRIGRGHIQMGPNEEVWGRTEREQWFGDNGYNSETQFWIINAGHKSDFTCKMWPEERYQEVVDHYQGRILFVQIGHRDHTHPKLDGVVNLIGKTDDRQLIRLVWASSGVLTPCSYPMTLAAAVPVRPGACNGRKFRPCVIVAGGREPSGWQAHTEHQFIHTCGMLPCCDHGGCWASRIKPIGDGDEKDRKNMCRHVVTLDNGVELPYCMDMITSEEVIRRIGMYYSFYEAGRKKTHSYNER